MIRTKLIVIFALLLAIALGAVAQETETAATSTAAATSTEAATTTTAAPAQAVAQSVDGEPAEGQSSYQLRGRLEHVIGQYPPVLGELLVRDPSLLTNENFMSGYPAVKQFIAANPEILRSPAFYLENYRDRVNYQKSSFESIMEGLAVFCVIGLIAFTLSWLVRTIVEQKRWNRLSRTQSEVHNKILDRFSTSEELLAYVRTPAGSKFLESAPIPLHSAKPAQSSPLSRVLWSVQVGVVIAIAAVGMMLVSFRSTGDDAQGIFSLGMIGFCVGAGFIASGFVSLAMSKRLGLWTDPATPPAETEDAGLMR